MKLLLFAGDPASQSTSIRWKDGADLTNRLKAKGQLKGRKRPLRHRTFFDWFTDHGDPSSDEIAELIKDDMWPNPLQVINTSICCFLVSKCFGKTLRKVKERYLYKNLIRC